MCVCGILAEFILLKVKPYLELGSISIDLSFLYRYILTLE